MLSPVRHFWLPRPQSSISFSTCPIEYSVEDTYSGPIEVPIKILLTSCSDLTVALLNLPVQSEQIIANIYSIFSTATLVARNTLFLKVLKDESFDPTNKNDISYLWNLWYDMKWSSETKERFHRDITQLCDGKLPSIIHPKKDFEYIADIWKKWVNTTKYCDTQLLQKVEKERYQAIADYFKQSMALKLSSTGDVKEDLKNLWEWLWTQTKAQEDFTSLPPDYSSAIVSEMKNHFVTGSCMNEETACLNPMFLDPGSMAWSLSPKVSAFESFVEPKKDDILTPYLQAFSIRVQEVQKTMKNTTFHLSFQDVFDICYHGLLEEFDIVDFARQNSTENFGIRNILNASFLMLSDNPHAFVVTESFPWSSDEQYQSVKEYVEHSLGTATSLIPSLYGFTLVNHLSLGNPLPLQGSHRSNVRLRWKKSPLYSNLKVKLLTLEQDLILKFQENCFITDAKCTPLSYALFASSVTSRILMEKAYKTKLHQPKIPSCYALAWKTFKAWMKGEEIVCVKACFNLTTKETGSLKIVLFDHQSEQYFDNFQMNRYGEALRVSFLLLKAHSLERKTLIYLSRGSKNTQVTSAVTLEEAYIKDYRISFPFQEAVRSSECFPCEESEDLYCVSLHGISQENLGVSTDLGQLSEARHEIRITSPNFDRIITFPWPFKISEVHSLGEEESLRLILPKAIHEPHPYEWDKLRKWSFESLSAWNNENLCKDLNFHLSAQFEYDDLKRQLMDLPDGQNSNGIRGVREVIRTIFQSAALDGQCWFVIESKHDPTMKNLWFLRVHLPVRISPWGSPLLFMTANDHRLAQKLVDRGILEQALATEDFKKFFVDGANSAVASVFVQSEEEENVLRHLLRLNSTLTDRCYWPIENLPIGKQSPWLATFLTPRYVDFAGTDEEMNELVELTNNLAIVSKEAKAFKELKVEPVEFCTKCSKIGDLKRCSRCKSVKYCSIDCQKSDWISHKSRCAEIMASYVA